MNVPILPILIIGCCLLGGCSNFYTRQSDAPSAMQVPKTLVHPVGKNWQVIEEAPKISDERGRLPFQTEQSLQPERSTVPVPAKNRTIETPR
ncbi:MAG TPA: hypothetical protein HPP97_03840 [Desulfuromonadales bacterium]|nr:hypothetical protein [Desulfuromonadales bacterium]